MFGSLIEVKQSVTIFTPLTVMNETKIQNMAYTTTSTVSYSCKSHDHLCFLIICHIHT